MYSIPYFEARGDLNFIGFYSFLEEHFGYLPELL